MVLGVQRSRFFPEGAAQGQNFNRASGVVKEAEKFLGGVGFDLAPSVGRVASVPNSRVDPPAHIRKSCAVSVGKALGIFEDQVLRMVGLHR